MRSFLSSSWNALRGPSGHGVCAEDGGRNAPSSSRILTGGGLAGSLKPGVLTYWTQQRAATLAVGEGFLQVAPVVAGNTSTDRVLVLVDRATTASSVDRAAAASELARLEKELAAWKQDLDGSYKALVVQRDWAQAQLDAAAKQNPS